MPSLETHGENDAPLHWADALSLADIGDPKYVVSSPNMTYIPSPHIGIVEVSMRADYRYGIPDPIQWPQVFTDSCDYVCSVLRPVPADDPYAPIWWTPNEDSDFVILEGSLFTSLGLLKPEAISRLGALVDELSELVSSFATDDSRLPWLKLAMCQTWDRLKYFPCTFRDAALQVRETQRYWLLTRACLDWEQKHAENMLGSPQPVNAGLMGAFSTDGGVIQKLHNAGIPVWYIRSDVSIMNDTSVRTIVIPTPPVDICVDSGPDGGHILYRGLAGTAHMLQTMRSGHTYLDVSRTPLLVVDAVGGYAAACSQKDYKGILVGGQVPTRTAVMSTPVVKPRDSEVRMKLKASSKHTPYLRPHASQTRGVNKFERFEHPWMPKELPAWQDAMRSVDLTQPARPNPEIWGYWIPEPALLLRPQSTDRRDRYIRTWLRMRDGWLYLLRVPDVPVTSVPSQWWRDVLFGPTGRAHDPSTLNARRWDVIKKVFGTIFEDKQFNSIESGPVWWLGHRINGVEPELCPGIIWEMFDLGFRYELLALDRLFVPSRNDPHGERGREDLLSGLFPSHHLYSITEMPSSGGAGLCALVPHARVPYLEAFRRVVSRWPACPASIHNASPFAISMSTDDILAREKEIAKFYVDTFFAQSGRAPIVPHQFPVVPDPA
ncbi:hypothetical protein K466DRAFT_604560 [Polyporus arcularius HHB13444]|uniref:Uncharacterized protein n=1 Tax=Polyporus arcularius HHB13444 TaxID=1314778 RepID=A0A5C3NV77_9APHY|nr:hypothetical protein K466DRAFT_604560 [Polyporus arcularius HHB13444]